MNSKPTMCYPEKGLYAKIQEMNKLAQQKQDGKRVLKRNIPEKDKHVGAFTSPGKVFKNFKK